jgi:hypothetical protein
MSQPMKKDDPAYWMLWKGIRLEKEGISMDIDDTEPWLKDKPIPFATRATTSKSGTSSRTTSSTSSIQTPPYLSLVVSWCSARHVTTSKRATMPTLRKSKPREKECNDN